MPEKYEFSAFRRPCRECGVYFKPTARGCRLCDPCKDKINQKRWENIRKSKKK